MRNRFLTYLGSLVPDRPLAVMLVLGFSSGIPYQLVYSTQSAWLTEAKVPISIIGLMSELTLAYKFKFVWAPFLDLYDAPLFSRLLGRRRGWIVVSQIAVMVALAGVAFGDPGHWLAWTIAFSLALGFAGATQDVVIDGWRAAYLCMAALMAPGMIAAYLAPESEADKALAAAGAGVRPNLATVIIEPIKEMVTRLGPLALPVLVMVAGFRMPGYVSNAMAVPLFKSLHYSNTDIATVTKIFGFGVGLAGTLLGTYIVPRIGIMASLLVGTVAGSSSHLALAYLAAHGDHSGGEFWTFATAVSIDSFAYAFASIVLITYMSSLASTELAASQYALLTSLCAFPGSIIAGLSGFVIERLGFTHFFILTSLIGVPVALLCWWVWRMQSAMQPAAAEPR